jgi:hypothetical protein
VERHRENTVVPDFISTAKGVKSAYMPHLLSLFRRMVQGGPKYLLGLIQIQRQGLAETGLLSHTFTAFARSVTSGDLSFKQGTDLYAEETWPSVIETDHLPRTTRRVWAFIGCSLSSSTSPCQPLPSPSVELLLKVLHNQPEIKNDLSRVFPA